MVAQVEQISPTRWIFRKPGQSAFDRGVMALQVDGETFTVGLVGGDTLVTGQVSQRRSAVWGDHPAKYVGAVGRLIRALLDSLNA